MDKILIFSNDDSHFYNHLIHIAIGAKRSGYEVVLLSNFKNHFDQISRLGVKCLKINFSRSGLNPFVELISLYKIIRIFRSQSPNIIHNFTIKPIFYGSIASLFCRKDTRVINTFLGLGYIFTKANIVTKMLRRIIIKTIDTVSKHRNTKTIVQNSDDKKILMEYGLSKPNNIFIQCSIGLNLSELKILNEPQSDTIIFVLIARMLKDKGIIEFVEAAKLLKQKKLNAEFWLVGEPDLQYNNTLTEKQLRDFESEGSIKYFGYQKIEKIWQRAHVAVLPSYREGLSRSLLEAAGFGKAIITTDAPGGRDLIEDKKSGLLVETRSHLALAEAMVCLINNPELRKKFGETIHQKVKEKYSLSVVTEKMLAFYSK